KARGCAPGSRGSGAAEVIALAGPGRPHSRLTQLANKWRQTLAKNVICLWYDGTAEEAARFYARTFPNSAVTAVHHAPGDYPDGKQGQVLTVEFTVVGVAC